MYKCDFSPPPDWCPSCPQAVISSFEPSLYTGHGIPWNRTSSGQFRSAVPILHRNGKVLDLGHALLKNKHNICGLLTLSCWIQNTACANNMNLVLLSSKKKNKLYSSQNQVYAIQAHSKLFSADGVMYTCRELEM